MEAIVIGLIVLHVRGVQAFYIALAYTSVVAALVLVMAHSYNNPLTAFIIN